MLHLPSLPLPLPLPFVTGEAKPLRQRGGRSEVRSFQWVLYNYYRNGDKSLFVLQIFFYVYFQIPYVYFQIHIVPLF